MRKGAQYGTVTIFTGWKSLGIFLLLFLLPFLPLSLLFFLPQKIHVNCSIS